MLPHAWVILVMYFNLQTQRRTLRNVKANGNLLLRRKRSVNGDKSRSRWKLDLPMTLLMPSRTTFSSSYRVLGNLSSNLTLVKWISYSCCVVWLARAERLIQKWAKSSYETYWRKTLQTDRKYSTRWQIFFYIMNIRKFCCCLLVVYQEVFDDVQAFFTFEWSKHILMYCFKNVFVGEMHT